MTIFVLGWIMLGIYIIVFSILNSYWTTWKGSLAILNTFIFSARASLEKLFKLGDLRKQVETGSQLPLKGFAP